MADTHCFAGDPFSDFHLVGESNRPNLRVAIECRSNPSCCRRREPNCDGVMHPVDVVADVFDDAPNFIGGRVD